MGGRPAILSGKPLREGKSWPEWPQRGDSERRLIEEVLDSGRWAAATGDLASRWASEFAAFQGGRHGLAVTNGTHTLETALAACDVGEGDEVIVPALTFVATATAALAVNATPILVDIDPSSLCLDVDAAEAAISERTRAVVAVHLAGAPCNLDRLVALCRRHDLTLIEDCAHAHGTRWRGRGVGTFGSFGSFSFQANKLMTAGEGGALITDDSTLRRRAWSYINCGRVGEHWYHHASYGSNMRMTEWQGAVLLAQLERYPEQLRTRIARARLLDAELAEIGGLRPQSSGPEGTERAYYAYVLHHDPDEFCGLSAAGLEAALAREGIPLCGKYKALNDFKLFKERNFGPRLRRVAPKIDYAALRFANAERAAERTVWLDHRVLLAPEEDVRDIVHAIARIKANARAVSLRTVKPLMFGSRALQAARRRLSHRG